MNKTLKIVLAVSALAAAAAGSIYLAKSGKLNEFLKLFKKEQNDACPFDSDGMTKDKLRKIAKEIKSDIEETAKRISDENHKKLQNQYDKMNWNIRKISKREMN